MKGSTGISFGRAILNDLNVHRSLLLRETSKHRLVAVLTIGLCRRFVGAQLIVEFVSGLTFLSVADGCETIECDFYAICDGDVTAGARCVCPSSCVQV